METNTFILVTMLELLLVAVFVLIFAYLKWRWKIPVLIFRYRGGKERPQLIPTRARFARVMGNGKLIIKGFKHSFKDFNSKYYYPTPKGNGALLLWEFKPGWVTPIIPKLKGLSREDKERVTAVVNMLGEYKQKNIKFEFDEQLYNELVLKAVDDINAEWYLRQQERIETQYTSGWRDFLARYSGHILTGFVVVLLFAGFVVWLKETPEMAGKCIQAGVESAKNTYLSEIAKGVASGVPPG